jgi:hypothetical protein
MVTPVQVYKTSDGSVFGDEAEALAHESGIKNKTLIQEFVSRHWPAPPEGEVNEKGNKKRTSTKAKIVADGLALFLAEHPLSA